MSDVFVSYARATEPQAKAIAEALRAQGYQRLARRRDSGAQALCGGDRGAAEGAKAVVVIWSADAAKSQWVRAEADAARELGTLIQVEHRWHPPPLPFNQIQCADLKAGAASEAAPGWRKLAKSVAALVGGEQPSG